MTIAEAIREYVNETEGLELYEQEPEKGPIPIWRRS